MDIYKATIDDFSFFISEGEPLESFKSAIVTAVRAGGDLINVDVLASPPMWVLVTPNTQIRVEHGLTGRPIPTAMYPVAAHIEMLDPYSELLDEL